MPMMNAANDAARFTFIGGHFVPQDVFIAVVLGLMRM